MRRMCVSPLTDVFAFWVLLAVVLPINTMPNAAQAQFTNAPRGATTLDWPFSVVSAPGGILNGSDAAYQTEGVDYGVLDFTTTTGMFSPPTAFYSRREALGGGGSRLYQFFSGTNEVYVALVATINPGFQGNSAAGNKIFLVNVGTMNTVLFLYGSAGGDLRIAWGTNTSGVSNTHIVDRGTTTDSLYANRGTTPFARGVWHTIEYYARASTSTTSRDGTLRWWLDGELQGDYTNVNNGPGPFTNIVMTPTWGPWPDCGPGGRTSGTGCAAGFTPRNTTEWNWYFDHMRIVSPGGVAPPDAGLADAGPSDAGVRDAGATIGDVGAPPRDTGPAAAPRPGRVSDLRVAAVGPNTVTLAFTEVDNGTGVGASYDVRFASPTISWGSASSVTTGTCTTPVAAGGIGSTRLCTIEGLTASTDYQVQLVAFRGVLGSATYGELSNVLSTRTTAAPADPGAVTDLRVAAVGPTSMTLAFTPVENGVGAPASYDVRFNSPTISWGSAPSVTMGTCTSPAVGTAVGGTHTCTIEGLTAGADYEVQLVAFRGVVGSATYGALSNVASTRTLSEPARPGAVTDLRVAAVGSSAMTVSFTTVDDGTGLPASYDVRFATPTISWDSAGSVTRGTCTPPARAASIGTRHTCTIEGLSEDTEYQVQLVAFRGVVGTETYGPLSNVASTRTTGGMDPDVMLPDVAVAGGCSASHRGSSSTLLVALAAALLAAQRRRAARH